jgi:hypothetical protein
MMQTQFGIVAAVLDEAAPVHQQATVGIKFLLLLLRAGHRSKRHQQEKPLHLRKPKQ